MAKASGEMILASRNRKQRLANQLSARSTRLFASLHAIPHKISCKETKINKKQKRRQQPYFRSNGLVIFAPPRLCVKLTLPA